VNHNLQVALKWQQAGAYVFVAKPENKRPLVEWRDKSTTDPDTVREWFKQWPNALPAIDLAKSGHVVIDGDRHGGPDGVCHAEQLFAERGLVTSAIPTVTTPQDGRHYWFKQPLEGEPITNSDKPVRDKGINVRGDGGYVIAPGALLPDGRGYKRAPNTPSTIEAVRDGTVPVLPPSIVTLLRPNGHDSRAAKPTSSREEGYAQAALDNVARQLATVAEGSRNIELNNGALIMGHMVASGWIGRATVEGRLFDAATACGLVKDDGPHSVRATIKSGLDTGEKEPHASLEDRGCLKGAKPLPPSEDPRPLIKSSKEFVGEFVPPDYLVDGLLQEGFLYSLTGATGAGKTAITLRLAASTALGIIFANRETKKKRVLYLAAENPDDVRMRWIALAQHMGFDVETIEVYFIEGVFKISEMADALRAETKRLGGEFGMLIVDTGPVFYEGDDENNRTQQGRHAVMLRGLIDIIPGRPTVLANCHPVKNASADNLIPAGGGNFLNQVDGNLTAAKTDSTTELHWQGKFRGVEFAPMHFMLKTVTHERLKDSRGRLIPTVISTYISDKEQEGITAQKLSDEDAVLNLIATDPKASQATIATAMGWKLYSGEPHKTKASRCIASLVKHKLVKETRGGGYKITPEGNKALEKKDDNDDDD